MLASRFLRLSILYALIGMALGIVMAAMGDVSQMPTHAHINLLGFVAMAIYGFFYRLYPAAEGGWMAATHFWVTNAGFVGLMLSVGAIHGGYDAAEAGASVFSLVVILGMALFAVIVFKATVRTA